MADGCEGEEAAAAVCSAVEAAAAWLEDVGETTEPAGPPLGDRGKNEAESVPPSEPLRGKTVLIEDSLRAKAVIARRGQRDAHLNAATTRSTFFIPDR